MIALTLSAISLALSAYIYARVRRIERRCDTTHRAVTGQGVYEDAMDRSVMRKD